MSNFTPILEKAKQLANYSERSRFMSVIVNSFQNRRNALTAEDKKELSEFALNEISTIKDLIPNAESYKEKDEIFEYGNNLIDIVALCYPSPTDLPEADFNKLRTFSETVHKERFVENFIDDIFENGNNKKENVELLLCALVPLKDEYQKGKFYQGLVHYKQKIKGLPEESKALLADYVATELQRYLEASIDDVTALNLEFACDAAGSLMNDDLIPILTKTLALKRSSVNYYAVSSLLNANQKVDADVIEALAKDLVHAALTYSLLKDHGLTSLFPAELANEEYLAKSDMVHWLIYPTELGKEPDKIEYIGKVKKKEVYHVFRFTSDSDNLGDDLKDKWLIGWSSDEGGTFSNFDLYEGFEQKTPEKTLKYIKKKLL